METISFAKLRHMFDNIFETISLEGYVSMIDTIRCSYTRIEESIKIIYLCNSTNCRSWIIRDGLLMDSNSRRESAYLTHMGSLRYIWYDRPSIGREWLKVSSLSFCIECVECKGWFPWSWHPSDHSESVFGDRYRDIFEIMCLSSDDLDSFWHKKYNKNTISLSYPIDDRMQRFFI